MCCLPSQPPVEPALSPPGSSSVCRWQHPGFPERAPLAPWPPAPYGSPCGTPFWLYPAVYKPNLCYAVSVSALACSLQRKYCLSTTTPATQKQPNLQLIIKSDASYFEKHPGD